MKVKNLIIGAGPCGLGAGYKLKENNNDDFLILERESCAGGLSRSFITDEGYLFEIGGHVHFSEDATYLDAISNVFGKENIFFHERKAYVYMDSYFVDYPFQSNLEQVRDKRILDNKVDENLKVQNFHNWLNKTFGDKVCEIFMTPYNSKVWSHSLEDMSFEWIEKRVATPVERKTKSWGPNSHFFFPKKGGTGAIWNSFAKYIGEEKIKYNTSVISIDLENKQVTTDNNLIIEFENLLNTTPLINLVKYANLKINHQDLKFNSLYCLGLGIEGKAPKKIEDKSWIYFPGKAPFYRMTVLSNYSNNNTPNDHCYSLLLEMTSSNKEIDTIELENMALAYLEEEGFIENRESIQSKWSFQSKFAYPIPTLGRNENLKEINRTLDKYSIKSKGRFGAWKYELGNQDHCFMQGYNWAKDV